MLALLALLGSRRPGYAAHRPPNTVIVCTRNEGRGEVMSDGQSRVERYPADDPRVRRCAAAPMRQGELPCAQGPGVTTRVDLVRGDHVGAHRAERVEALAEESPLLVVASPVAEVMSLTIG